VLGGFFIVAVAALTMSYMMQRRASERERRQREALTSLIRRMHKQLAAKVPILPALQPDTRSRATNEALVPVAIMRRVRVVQNTRRRLHLTGAADTRDHTTEEHDAEPLLPQVRTSGSGLSAPAELLVALAQLRGELMRLQGRSAQSTISNRTGALSRQASR